MTRVVRTAPCYAAVAEQVGHVFDETFTEPPYRYGSAALGEHRGRLARLAAQPGSRLALAETDGQVVGFALAVPTTLADGAITRLTEQVPELAARWAAQELLALTDLAVAPQARRTGRGRALHDWVLHGYRATGVLTLRSDAEQALAAYRAWGWRDAGLLAGGSGHADTIVLDRPTTR